MISQVIISFFFAFFGSLPDTSTLNLTLFLTAVYHTSKFTPQLIQTLSQASETARLLVLTDQSSLEGFIASLDGRAAIILHFPWEFTPSETPCEEIAAFRDFSCVFASPLAASPSPFVSSPRYFQVYRQTGFLDVRGNVEPRM